MKTRDFYFDLPEELIAQHPADRRDVSRLLVLNRTNKEILHSKSQNLAEHIDSDTLIVRNNTMVRKARVFAVKSTGAKIEFLFLEQKKEDIWLVMASKSKKQKIGDQFELPGGIACEILDSEETETAAVKRIKLSKPIDETYFQKNGHIPLPPYIRREDIKNDEDRYQTIYAKSIGSVAAPTAGLHFTHKIEEEFKKNSVDIVDITLHVGLGTFLPIRTEDISLHTMHTEKYHISQEAAAKINQAKSDGKKILAVGTTSVRTLEAAADDNSAVVPGFNSTNLFIKPGYSFKIVDCMLTNFHTPESTLLILVSAFAGKDLIFTAYKEAVAANYRFFSYGDAMLIL
ncbi:MAG: tRNA preQ1(34) S-adenosylmethionine ribosyltransferase-isomerase QueA [Spirochaetia bacterium]|nr:tRNA preQ1(34) S-adenosylmethionine ribosyltransferase-isomerase QueA [Spirochaetia bacterium]MCF7946370.1 tRNA preQ1(34) S-adenosylmethionine ribosyltransferase-isomerase QueA [Spirochaetia bacterium]